MVNSDDRTTLVGFAAAFPTPRQERVSPGHLVAVATGAEGRATVVWRWCDAVVLGAADDGDVRLWEPAHGEAVANTPPSCPLMEPGTRAYASAGLPGADWWVADSAERALTARVELDEVRALYTEHGLWASAFVGRR